MSQVKKFRVAPVSGTNAALSALYGGNFIPAQGEIIVVLGSPTQIKIGDGTSTYSALPYYTTSSPLTLQQVTDAGHVTTDIVNVRDSYFLADSSLGVQNITIDANTITINNGAGKRAKIVNLSLGTDNVLFEIPNKSTTQTFAMISDIISAGALDAVLALGNLSDIEIKIGTVLSALFSGSDLSNSGYIYYISGVTTAALTASGGGTGILSLVNGLSGHLVNITPGALTAARTQNLPDKSGTFAMLSDITTANALPAVLSAGNSATTPIIIGAGTNKSTITNVKVSVIYNGYDISAINYIVGVPNLGAVKLGTSGIGLGTSYFNITRTSDNVSVTQTMIPKSGNIALGDNGTLSVVSIIGVSVYAIAHGLPYTPSRVVLQVTSAVACANTHYRSLIDATNITITFTSYTGGGGTDALSWDFFAAP